MEADTTKNLATTNKICATAENIAVRVGESVAIADQTLEKVQAIEPCNRKILVQVVDGNDRLKTLEAEAITRRDEIRRLEAHISFMHLSFVAPEGGIRTTFGQVASIFSTSRDCALDSDAHNGLAILKSILDDDYIITFDKRLIMCLCTLSEVRARGGDQTMNEEDPPFLYEILVKRGGYYEPRRLDVFCTVIGKGARSFDIGNSSGIYFSSDPSEEELQDAVTWLRSRGRRLTVRGRMICSTPWGPCWPPDWRFFNDRSHSTTGFVHWETLSHDCLSLPGKQCPHECKSTERGWNVTWPGFRSDYSIPS